MRPYRVLQVLCFKKPPNTDSPMASAIVKFLLLTYPPQQHSQNKRISEITRYQPTNLTNKQCLPAQAQPPAAQTVKQPGSPRNTILSSKDSCTSRPAPSWTCTRRTLYQLRSACWATTALRRRRLTTSWLPLPFRQGRYMRGLDVLLGIWRGWVGGVL